MLRPRDLGDEGVVDGVRRLAAPDGQRRAHELVVTRHPADPIGDVGGAAGGGAAFELVGAEAVELAQRARPLARDGTQLGACRVIGSTADADRVTQGEQPRVFLGQRRRDCVGGLRVCSVVRQRFSSSTVAAVAAVELSTQG